MAANIEEGAQQVAPTSNVDEAIKMLEDAGKAPDEAPAPAPVPAPAPKPAETPAPAPEPAPAPKAESPVTKFASLAKKEKELRKAQAQLEQRQNELQELQEFVRQFKADPFALIEKQVGPDAYQQYTKRVLGVKDEAVPVNPILEKRVVEAESKAQQALAKLQAEEDARLIAEYERQITTVASSSDFESLSSSKKAQAFAVKYAKDYYKETGEVLMPKEVCEAVEQYLKEIDSEREAARAAKSKSVETKPAPVAPTPKPQASKLETTSAAPSNKVETEQDRLREALELAEMLSKG